ncbi:MAG: AAA family ATPase [Lachnospiraceae bacterium]|nr:AAA family ATPase [Lachnospiraceae bacterium]
MLFIVLEKNAESPKDINCIIFRRDGWDDYCFKTSFDATYVDESGCATDLGAIKIAYTDMEIGRIYDSIPKRFERLPQNYYSLWQSEESYLTIKKLEDTLYIDILKPLNDIAYNTQLLNEHLHEDVMQKSLLRFVSEFKCKRQFNRIARGGAVLTPYQFSYLIPAQDENFASTKLEFQVKPYAFPPTNVHVLIGRNGTGKTHLIQDMIKGICLPDSSTKGIFQYPEEEEYEHFANVLCVAFSPFDNFSEYEIINTNIIKYSYVGLDRENPNLIKNIENQYIDGLKNCLANRKKKKNLIETISLLKSDPAFDEVEMNLWKNENEQFDSMEDNEVTISAKEKFSELSSGHKVVLSILTCCIDLLEEQSIIFIDEPENHLHPPLLSAFVRALSSLLIERNGVAIISTHSPVVLQEVPRSCVWLLNRYGSYLEVQRPEIETFGSNIGILTSEVFGLEVKNSGFHKMLKDAVMELDNYDEVLGKFKQQLGDEAKGIVRILFALKERGEL